MEALITHQASLLRKLILVVVLGFLASESVRAQPVREISSLFNVAEREGRIGYARKTKLVDVRTAVPGEEVITIIKDEGPETQSPPARKGDMVVRNRCNETGNEEILVKRSEFLKRYEGPIGSEGADGWRTYRPRGRDILYFRVRQRDGTFMFKAPWGNEMVARPRDVIVRDPAEPKDTYRIAAAAFSCTYKITRPKKLH